ncbi:single-stranded DNA-binding protein [bacterium]|nr:MAG: single-stranded DNA-binding protein [bacterium]
MSGTVNKVILIGRLGRDPEIRYTPSGQALAKFSMATDENRKDQDGNWQTETTWHNIVLWAKNAERAGEYLKKGHLIFVEGRISNRSWDDPETGQKKYMTEIVGLQFKMLESRGDNAQSQDSESTSQTQPTQSQQVQEDDDLPF